MHIHYRRIITAAFFLTFFILGPILLLYSSGFRIDYKRGKVVRTGNIFIEAKDLTLAKVLLDGVPYKEPLTKKVFINNLIPGDYDIAVEKEDRYTWEKKVHVNAGLTTFILDIQLFLKQSPELSYDGQIENLSLSPDGQSALYTKTGDSFKELYVLDILRNDEQLLYRASPNANFTADWSPSSNKVLVITQQTGMVFTSRTPLTTQTFDITSDTINTVWDREKDTYLYQISKNEITRFNTLTQKPEVIYHSQGELVPDVLGLGENVFCIEKFDDQVNLLQIRSQNSIQNITSLPWSSSYKFLETTNSLITIANRSLNKIFLIQRDFDKPSTLLQQNQIIFDAEFAQLSPDKSKLLLHDDFEVKYFDLATRQLKIITRFGSPIRSADWYSNNQHIILALDTQLIISDLYTNYENSQISLLSNGSNLTNSVLYNNKVIYFTGELDQKAGLFTLKIK